MDTKNAQCENFTQMNLSSPGLTGWLSEAVLWPIAVAQGAMDIGHTQRPGPYISELWALNIHNGEPGGDWHRAAWFRREKLWRDEIPLYKGRTLKTLGGTDVYDSRRALRGQGHPQGWRLEPVWAAGHARACVDLAGRYIEVLAKSAREKDYWEIDPTAEDLMGWLMSARKVRYALNMAQRMAQGDEEFADVWEGWVRKRSEEIRSRDKVTI